MTEERKPEVWSARVRVRIMLLEGTEVRPRRAREAFWRCEQTLERCTRDIVRWFSSWGGRGPSGRSEGKAPVGGIEWESSL